MDRFMEERVEMVKIGNYCKTLREKLQITQRELATEFNVPLARIQNFEYGKINSSVMYHKYLKFFKIID